MHPSGSDRWRRRAFAPGDADAIVAFCVAHGSYDAVLLRLLMLEMTSGPAGVIVVEDGDGVGLVATVVDRMSNGADAATLETLGVRAAPPAAAFVGLVVEPAVAFARAGERRALQVPVPPSLAGGDGIEEALRAAGLAHAYDTFEMRRPESAPPPAPPEPLPPGWSWTQVDATRADAAHAALGEMFRDAPSTNARPLADFRQAIVSGEAIWHALLDDDPLGNPERVPEPSRDGTRRAELAVSRRERIAGMLRVVAHGARGEVRILGRVPAYRGRGLGPRLLSEGLRLLRAGGAGDIDLAVEAANDRALDLYRRFGFEVVMRTPVYLLPLRG